MTLTIQIPTAGRSPQLNSPVPFMEEAVKYMEYAAHNFSKPSDLDYLELFNRMINTAVLCYKDFNPTVEFEYECHLSKQTIKTSVYAFARQVTNKHPELAGFELDIVDKFGDKILADTRAKFSEQNRLSEMLVKKPDPVIEVLPIPDAAEEFSEDVVEVEMETHEIIMDAELADYDFEAEYQASLMDDPELIDCAENYDASEEEQSFIAAETMDYELVKHFAENFNRAEEQYALLLAEDRDCYELRELFQEEKAMAEKPKSHFAHLFSDEEWEKEWKNTPTY